MNQDERLSGALQENILVLLCFDNENCKLVRAAVTPHLFESAVFKEVAGHAIDFIDQFGTAIGEHLPDHLEHILNGDNKRKAETYRRLLENLFVSKDSVNSAYVISQLHKFVRLQNLKSSLILAVEAAEDGRIDEAELEIQKGLSNQVISFEPGLNLSSASDVAEILDNPEEEGFDLGIEELDRLGIIPRRKEAFMFLAPRGVGKSWWITHVAKRALIAQWSVLIVTLEMSERRYGARMLQSFFSVSRRKMKVLVTRLQRDHNGNLESMMQEELERMSFADDNIKEVLVRKARHEFRRRPPFRIKEFASGTLNLAGLNAYLDGLERFEKFTPDLVCVDYPDLMEVDKANLRIELGKLIVGLRGIATTRNCAMMFVSQGNRDSETATTVTGSMAAEDISKLATVDTALTYSQTPHEKSLGLARLLVEKARNEESKMSILITQAYALGQFCLDSIRLKKDYWKMMGRDKAKADGEDEEEEEKDDRPRRDRPRAGR